MVKPTPVNPPAMGRPLGYSHGMRAGNLLFVAGQIGADPLPDGRHRVVSTDFTAQFEKAIQNVRQVVAAAGAGPEAIVEMTVFVKDMDAYRDARPRLAAPWKRAMGKHFPAMTLVAVADLFEEGALVEVRAVAVVD